jgi:hypothetical protein
VVICKAKATMPVHRGYERCYMLGHQALGVEHGRMIVYNECMIFRSISGAGASQELIVAPL